MLKSLIPQVSAYCILLTVLFHLFTCSFLIIFWFVLLKNCHVGNDSQSKHNIQQTKRTSVQSYAAYLGPFVKFLKFYCYEYTNERTNIFKAKNAKLILSTTQGNANEFVPYLQSYWLPCVTINTTSYIRPQITLLLIIWIS